MSVLAHAGHWLVDFLYAAPVLLLLGFLARERFGRRGSGRDGSD